jgi:hypothetical protein
MRRRFLTYIPSFERWNSSNMLGKHGQFSGSNHRRIVLGSLRAWASRMKIPCHYNIASMFFAHRRGSAGYLGHL